MTSRARIHYFIPLCLACLLLFPSCSSRQQAKSLVSDFVATYALHPDSITNRSFANLDSTRLISDSLLLSLRQQRDPLFKHPIPYPDLQAQPVRHYLRMRFTYKGQESARTFYFNREITEITAIK